MSVFSGRLVLQGFLLVVGAVALISISGTVAFAQRDGGHLERRLFWWSAPRRSGTHRCTTIHFAWIARLPATIAWSSSCGWFRHADLLPPWPIAADVPRFFAGPYSSAHHFSALVWAWDSIICGGRTAVLLRAGIPLVS